MSLTTLKRKTDGTYHVSGGKHGKGYVNHISSGRPAFSLNDSRRVGAHSGDTSIQTRMRGKGYCGHGGRCGKFIINPVRSSYQNDYDPFGKARVGRPQIIPSCPVVQPLNQVDFESKYQEKIAIEMKKDLCDPTSKNSGKCSGERCAQPSTYVKRPVMDYSQYLARKKNPLPLEKSHYPPRVSRNSIFVSVPNVSYANFIQRVTCK